jgi:hypothetical protein
MEDLVEWMFTRSREHYNLLTNNCQQFASELTEYLSGISVARTPIILAPAAPVLAPVWKVVNGVRGWFNRIC